MPLRTTIFRRFAFGLCLAASAGAAVPKAKEPPGLEVLVAADAVASAEGFRPKPGKPIHFVFTQTRQSLGDVVAGVKLPSPAVVEQFVVAELTKQGFVRAQTGGPSPQIIILAVVGDANFEEPAIDFRRPDQDPDFRPYMDMVNLRSIVQRDPLNMMTAPTLEAIFDESQSLRTMDVNNIREAIIAEARRYREKASPRGKDKPQIQGLVGAEKIMRATEINAISPAEAQRFVETTHENSLYITLNAYDAVRWTQKKERILLWRTTMLIDWRRDFTKELPAMLARAGPIFGTDDLPAFLDTRDQRKADVEIGELKVVPEPSSSTKPQPKK